MEIGDEVRAVLPSGAFVRGTISQILDDIVVVGQRRFPLHAVTSQDELYRRKEAAAAAEEEELRIEREAQEEARRVERAAAEEELRIEREAQERIAAEEKAMVKARAVAARKRRKEAFGKISRRGNFYLSLISREDLLDDFLTWYNRVSTHKTLQRQSPGVFGYLAKSKGGLQLQGRTTDPALADLFKDGGFTVLERNEGFEINNTALWEDAIQAGEAFVGVNEGVVNEAVGIAGAQQAGL